MGRVQCSDLRFTMMFILHFTAYSHHWSMTFLCLFYFIFCSSLPSPMKVLVVQSCLTPCNPAGHQALCPWDSHGKNAGFSRQECWSRLLSPPPGDLADSETESKSLMSPALAGGFFTTRVTLKPIYAYIFI